MQIVTRKTNDKKSYSSMGYTPIQGLRIDRLPIRSNTVYSIAHSGSCRLPFLYEKPRSCIGQKSLFLQDCKEIANIR